MNLLLQKACRKNLTNEPNLSTPCDDERKGIEFIADVNQKYAFWMYVVPLIFCAFISAWSDKVGNNRKQLIVISATGHILQNVSMCLQSYYWHLSPLLCVWTRFICETFFLGGIGIHIFVTMLVCDLVDLENRTVSLTVLLAVDLMCSPLSSGTSGYLLHLLGFFYSYLLCVFLAIIGFICALCAKDTSKPHEKIKCSIIWDILLFKYVIESCKIVFKKTTGKSRLVISILFFQTVLLYFALFGEKSVFYLYLRYRFKWNETKYGVYIFYKISGSLFGLLLSSLIFNKLLKLHDCLIGAFAGFWDTMTVLAYFFATENWQLYLIPMLDIFHGVALTVCKSYITKLFDTDQLGRVFCVKLMACVLVAAAAPTYNFLFKKTMDAFPQAIFLLSIVLNGLVCFLYGICYSLTKSKEEESNTEKST
ncbi:hypothetical protein PGB90_009895 [Kerria lacca]